MTDDRIQDVGALTERLQAKRAADKAAEAEKRLKSYGRMQPLGVHATPAPSLPPSAVLPQPGQDSLVIAPPPVGDARPEVAPDQPPIVAAPPPSPVAMDQEEALAPDLPNQPPAADVSQPAIATEPSVGPSSALPPTGEPRQAALVEDGGPGWCKKLEEALQQGRAKGRAIVVAEDVHEGGAKRWGSFIDVAALMAYRRSMGPCAHLYEVIQDDACWRIYLDLDLSLPSEDRSDFDRRLEAFHLVRDRFLTSVKNVPEVALRFQACEAHGAARPPKQGFKYSVHEVLEGFYLRGLDVRRAFGEAFNSFLENPPDDLKPSVELVRTGPSTGATAASDCSGPPSSGTVSAPSFLRRAAPRQSLTTWSASTRKQSWLVPPRSALSSWGSGRPRGPPPPLRLAWGPIGRGRSPSTRRAPRRGPARTSPSRSGLSFSPATVRTTQGPRSAGWCRSGRGCSSSISSRLSPRVASRAGVIRRQAIRTRTSSTNGTSRASRATSALRLIVGESHEEIYTPSIPTC